MTEKDEIEKGIDAVLSEIAIECKERFGVGRRGDYGLVVFHSFAVLQDILKKNDGKSFVQVIEGEEVSLKATRKGDPVWLEATKHERALLTALGNKYGIPREKRNKNPGCRLQETSGVLREVRGGGIWRLWGV